MQPLLRNEDLRSLFNGVAGVAAAGLALGLIMQPNLDAHSVEGPQMLFGASGARVEPTRAERGLAAYGDYVPDYVLGTDWATQDPVLELKETELTDEEPAPKVVANHDPAGEIGARQVGWRDELREPTTYPSVTGDAAYEVELPPPPPPPEDADLG
jgi:hypothetical protein